MDNDLANIIGHDQIAMQRLVGDLGERSFRSQQLMKWVHQARVTDFSAMTNLSKALRERLTRVARVVAPRVVEDTVSADGTRKWLLRLDDGNCIETVFIPESDRGTLCVSSQVGCALNCSFCATARQGYNRNLTSAEIVGQVWRANQLVGVRPGAQRPVTNVVLMGMGEPLLNFAAVVPAMRVMLDDFGYGFSRRRVTLSTAGVVPAIYKLKNACPVSLAVSLHAPNDTLRNQLVPLNKKYPIARLMEACRAYVADEARARVTFEYVMLAGVNDTREHARELISHLRSMPAKVNLIPFNSFPNSGYASSGKATIDRFREQLLEAGIMTITRKTRGDDIAAACGQLAGRVIDRTHRAERFQRLAGAGG
ncbi:MAG: 23S rRNA (adenine(2503)-C(2))-methyltransferase RlmN [Gammaproteobacteria bacterium]|nr:23S rRNA (adenine(2503)-C(2))-methyltransferase RlmN [Gammaproteobacteria bacterium]